MDVKMSFRNMKGSSVVEDYALRKILPRIAKYAEEPLRVSFVFDKQNDSYACVSRIVGPTGVDVRLNQAAPNMFAAIDLLSERLERVLRRKKERLKAHKFKDFKRKLFLSSPELGLEREEAGEWIDAAEVISFEKARLARRDNKAASGN